MSLPEQQRPPSAPQDPWRFSPSSISFPVKIALFVILSYSLIGLISSIWFGQGLFASLLGLGWNLFFGYFYLTGKIWAKWALLAKAGLTFLLYGGASLANGDYLALLFDGSFNLIIILLLWGNVTSKRAVFCLGTYLLLVASLTNILYNHYQAQHTEELLIRAAPVVKEYRSEKHYKVNLDKIDWKVLSRTDSHRLLGDDAMHVDCSIVKVDGTAFGILIPEKFEGQKYDENLSNTVEHKMKANFEGQLEGWQRYDQDQGFMLTATSISSPHQNYVMFFKNMNSIGVYAILWSPSEKSDHLMQEASVIYQGLSAIPLKERLAKFSPSQVYSENKDAVVLITVNDANGKMVSFGSGFNIAPEGLIVTNMHVILNQGYYIEVKFPHHGSFKDVKIIGLGANGLDLALLAIPGNNLPKVQGLRSVEVVPGDRVFVIGNPEGYLNSLSDGIIGAIRQDEWGCVSYQMTAAVSGGSSGGPVFNEFGEVIGIATATVVTGQNLNFSISVDELQKVQLLEKPVPLKTLMEYLEVHQIH